MEVLTIDAMVLMLRAAAKTSSEKSGVSDGKAALIVLRMGRNYISSIRAQPSQHRDGHGKPERCSRLVGWPAYPRAALGYPPRIFTTLSEALPGVQNRAQAAINSRRLSSISPRR